jgi:hypothetical protein
MLNGDGYWSADVVKADRKPAGRKADAAAKKGQAGGAGAAKGVKVGGKKKNNKPKVAKDPALLKMQQKARAIRNARGGGGQVRAFSSLSKQREDFLESDNRQSLLLHLTLGQGISHDRLGDTFRFYIQGTWSPTDRSRIMSRFFASK